MPIDVRTVLTANGGSVDITVFEDTDGDGTAENQETQNFTASTTATFSSLDGTAGNTYWLEITENSGTDEDTPTVDSVRLLVAKSSELVTDSTLNGGSVNVTVFEDTDGDGTAELSETVALSGGSETIDLYEILAGSGHDVWLQIEADSAGDESTPTVNSITVRDIGKIEAQAATLSITGQNAGVSPGDSPISSQPASIQAAGQNAAVSPGDTSIQADLGAITLVPQDAVVDAGVAQIAAGEASVDITAQNAGRVFDSTTLSGTVSLNGSGVESATIYCIDTTNQDVAEVTTTDQNGDYRVRVDTGDLYHMVVQYEDDQGNQYNDESKPFIAT